MSSPGVVGVLDSSRGPEERWEVFLFLAGERHQMQTEKLEKELSSMERKERAEDVERRGRL